ncbi:hypothetical protein Ciccas_012930 [Cichlidogyrus casuarinus]|uniref:Uncharacterized protein n=1 Tax=Cichlidogyrus casuarinus TaxID=1844966 RepID=A0ABD2PLZ6_9PLAT
MSRSHKYKVLEYFKDKLYKTDDKVKNITQLNKNDFYTHSIDACDRKIRAKSSTCTHSSSWAK